MILLPVRHLTYEHQGQHAVFTFQTKGKIFRYSGTLVFGGSIESTEFPTLYSFSLKMSFPVVDEINPYRFATSTRTVGFETSGDCIIELYDVESTYNMDDQELFINQETLHLTVGEEYDYE